MYVSLCTDLLLISREIKLSVLFLDASLITNLLFMMSSHTVQVVPDICLFSVTYQCIYSCDFWHHIPYLIGTKSTFSWLLSSVLGVISEILGPSLLASQQPLLGICAGCQLFGCCAYSVIWFVLGNKVGPEHRAELVCREVCCPLPDQCLRPWLFPFAKSLCFYFFLPIL